ncbi:Bifunctional protein HldE [Paraburkholderia sediminicola]|uniref:Bifunctional protein HldE n=1 Tax=Paraburkholderia sediminicola TaxID=458836 RepID=A0A6J5BNP3_9BURK|nr:D-glycero-beta-D-manno-heptose-7-phosphate kinase [Paraburkholderia sediminicola]CAB3712349.1 Bifunctional protein HldE [Paraburkholderia sediminicola]
MSLDCSSAFVIVAGDVMLDRYWFGDSTRISPEAPVPVVHVRRTRDVAGGAANVAINAVNLGARTTLLSIVGDDQDGRSLRSLLESANVQCAFLHDAALQTTVKLRVISRNQQIVRADFEQRPDHELLLPLVARFHEKLESCKTVVFSDYGKGGLVHLGLMMEAGRAAGSTILIDPKGHDYSIYRGATVVTPNRDEFAQAAGKWTDESDFERRAFALRDSLELAALLVTRSEEGMSLFLEGRHIRIPAQAREVYDVSGAGDTVIATMAAAMGAGHNVESAARLANVAAGIVVGKVGTAPITLEELNQHV